MNDGIVRLAAADTGAAFELNGVRVLLYPSEMDPGTVSVQIETDKAPGQKVRVMLNDADLFDGDPEHDDHPWSRQVQEYYDNQRREATAECKHCGRTITKINDAWVDEEATGDDSVWRETCDSHDTFTAEHEPKQS